MAEDEAEEQEPPVADEEALRRLEEQVKQLRVADVVVQSVFQISSLGWLRLGADARDLDQARLAIDVLRGLVASLEGVVDAAMIRDFQQMVANMQLTYASATREAAAAGEADGP